jgi:hypothetical protein
MPLSIPLSLNDLQKISYSLNQEYPHFNKIGEVTKEGRWNHIVNGLTHRIQPRLLVLIERVNQSFAHLEQKGVKIFDPTIKDEDYVEKAHRYRATRQVYLDLATDIGHQIEQLQKVSPELKKAYHELQCREVGLRYSLGQANGGVEALEQPDEEWLVKIKELAQAWKEKQTLAVEKELNELEIEQLKELSTYPQWLEIVTQNPVYLSEVFNWCLRDFNQVEVMVKCYETRRKLKVALLSANLGYVRNFHLREKEEDVLAFRTVPTKVDQVAKRILTVPIYHGSFCEFEPEKQERVNILKPTEDIHFQQGNYNLTVAEFLEEIGEKNQREANLTLCADWGFVNFHPVKGMWNADLQKYEMPEMTEENWTDHVPASQVVSHEELVDQYGDEVEGRDFFFKIAATRQNLNLIALDCHSYWQLYLRMEDGDWRVLNIGLYAYRFQQGVLDGLWLFCATLKRVVCLLDQNGYYTHRQRAAYPIFPDEETQEKLLARIFFIMNTSGVFQFAGRNCAYPIQKLTGKLVEDSPNFFKMSLTMGKTGVGPIDRILEWAHGQWEWVRWLIVTCLHTSFLSARSLSIKTKEGEETDYSVREYFSNHGHHIYNPSYLPYQIAQARQTGQGPFVKGELYWSHTDEKIPQWNVKEALEKDE